MLTWLVGSSSILETGCNLCVGQTKDIPKENILPKKILSNPYRAVVALKNQRDMVPTVPYPWQDEQQ